SATVASVSLQKKALSPQVWQALIWLGLCGLVFAPTWLSLFDKWTMLDESYGHGFLVLALMLWLVVRALPVNTPVQPVKSTSRTTWMLALAAAGAAALWALAWLTGVEFVQQLLIPAI